MGCVKHHKTHHITSQVGNATLPQNFKAIAKGKKVKDVAKATGKWAKTKDMMRCPPKEAEASMPRHASHEE